MIVGKIWGTTEVLLATPLLEVHRLVIKPNAQCSFHKHQYKHNAFFVVFGDLIIEVEKIDYQLTDETFLGPGDMTTVKPSEYHRFKTRDIECVALELYYCEALGEDIFRRDVGSVTQ